jgi:hypothetical protein
MLISNQFIFKTHSKNLKASIPRLFIFLLIFLNLCPTFCFAQPEPPSALSSLEIKTRKLSVESEYKKDLEDCYQKFMVNQCKDTAFSKRAAALSTLRQYELKNNEIERIKQADQLKKETQTKVDERARDVLNQKEQSNANYEERLKVNKEKNEQHDKKFNETLNSNTNAEPSQNDRTPMSSPAADARAKFEAKQRAAEAHKEQVLKRLAEKEKSKIHHPEAAPASVSPPAPGP